MVKLFTHWIPPDFLDTMQYVNYGNMSLMRSKLRDFVDINPSDAVVENYDNIRRLRDTISQDQSPVNLNILLWIDTWIENYQQVQSHTRQYASKQYVRYVKDATYTDRGGNEVEVRLYRKLFDWYFQPLHSDWKVLRQWNAALGKPQFPDEPDPYESPISDFHVSDDDDYDSPQEDTPSTNRGLPVNPFSICINQRICTAIQLVPYTHISMPTTSIYVLPSQGREHGRLDTS